MKQNRAVIIPTMRYKDASNAIEWLCNVFGFEQHLVVPGENGTIAHAQLSFGNAMVMIGSENDDEYGKLFSTPKDLNGLNTQAPYIVVENIDDHFEKARQEGAEIVITLRNEDYGGRSYTCRDNEGFIWNFGSYDPWKG